MIKRLAGVRGPPGNRASDLPKPVVSDESLPLPSLFLGAWKTGVTAPTKQSVL